MNWSSVLLSRSLLLWDVSQWLFSSCPLEIGCYYRAGRSRPIFRIRPLLGFPGRLVLAEQNSTRLGQFCPDLAYGPRWFGPTYLDGSERQTLGLAHRKEQTSPAHLVEYSVAVLSSRWRPLLIIWSPLHLPFFCLQLLFILERSKI